MGMKGKVALGAVVGFVVIGVVSANAGDHGNGGSTAAGGKKSSASAQSQHSSTGKKKTDRKQTDGKKTAGKKSAEKKSVVKQAAFAGDGDFQVGSDIKPGTYRTTGNSDGMCYWERAKDAKGEMDSIIANDNVSGTSYVTVKATDKLFKSSGCKSWEAVGPKTKGTPGTRMAGDGGMFRVGSDIAPGTYRSTGNKDDSCYWERAKDADHSLHSIVANNNVTGTAVVTISPRDAYFRTTGCGDWQKTA